jgi:hypothetical protein
VIEKQERIEPSELGGFVKDVTWCKVFSHLPQDVAQTLC